MGSRYLPGQPDAVRSSIDVFKLEMDIKCEGSDSDNEVKIEDEIHVGTKDALNMRNEPRMKVEPGVKREPEIKHETSTTQGRLIKKELLDQDLIIPESMPHRVHDERASSQLLVKGGVPIKPEPTTNNEMDVQYELDERHQSAIRTVMVIAIDTPE